MDSSNHTSIKTLVGLSSSPLQIGTSRCSAARNSNTSAHVIRFNVVYLRGADVRHIANLYYPITVEPLYSGPPKSCLTLTTAISNFKHLYESGASKLHYRGVNLAMAIKIAPLRNLAASSHSNPAPNIFVLP